MRHVNDGSVAVGAAAAPGTTDDEHEFQCEGEFQGEGDGEVVLHHPSHQNPYCARDGQSPGREPSATMIPSDDPFIRDGGGNGNRGNDRTSSPGISNERGDDDDDDDDDGGFWSHARLAVRHFASLPPQLLVVLTLEFLNTFRVWGFYFVIYDYATNEFGMSDGTAGAVLGAKGALDVAFGLLGSILVDRYGVRRTSVFALGVAVVGRTLLSFGRSRGSLYLALFLFSPVGESLLNTGLYSVALKKLTTPRTRAVAFSVTYATKNLSGAAADVLIGLMRRRPDSLMGGMVFTPTRKFLIVTLGTVIASFVLALLWLRDLTVADLEDPEDGVEVPDDSIDAGAMCPCLAGTRGGDNGNGGTIRLFKTEAISLSPSSSSTISTGVEMVGVGVAASSEEEEEGGHSHSKLNRDDDDDEPDAGRSTPAPAPAGNLRVDDADDGESPSGAAPPPARPSSSSPRAVASWTVRHVRDILSLRSARRVLLFGVAAFPIGWQWEASYIALPAFLERTYGEGAPIYTVQSINMWGCLLFPPVVGTLTTAADLGDFAVIMPGLCVMALAPLAVAVWSNVAGAAVWQVFMTLGEVVWAPRFQSWTAGLAPVGKEGLFFSVANARFFLSPLADWVLGRWNEWYVPNCEGCRDSYGHFCDSVVVDDTGGGATVCASVEETCGSIPWTNDDGRASCPSSCLECPGWESDSTTLWSLLLISSLVTPVLVWVLLPFFRDGEDLKNVCRLGRFLGRDGKEYESAHGGDDYDADDADGGGGGAASASPTMSMSHHGRRRRASYEKVANGGEGNSLSHRSIVQSNGFVDGGSQAEAPEDEDGGYELT